MLKHLSREPLLHFGLLAALIFALYGLVAPQGGEPDDTSIVVTAPKIEQIASIFERTWQRRPTASELQGLVDDFVDEEIYVRAALALGLDQGDTVIRRRLRQKMEFLQDAETDKRPPTEAELAAYLAAHSDRFALDPQVAFEQIFFSPDKRGDAVKSDAAAALASLVARPGADAAGFGDPSLLPPTIGLTPLSELDRQFGTDFAAPLLTAQAGVWSGPVASAYGLHIVRIAQVEPGRVPPLDEVRPAVLREWTNARSSEIAAARRADLRQKFTVTIEFPATTETAP